MIPARVWIQIPTHKCSLLNYRHINWCPEWWAWFVGFITMKIQTQVWHDGCKLSSAGHCKIWSITYPVPFLINELFDCSYVLFVCEQESKLLVLIMCKFLQLHISGRLVLIAKKLCWVLKMTLLLGQKLHHCYLVCTEWQRVVTVDDVVLITRLSDTYWYVTHVLWQAYNHACWLLGWCDRRQTGLLITHKQLLVTLATVILSDTQALPSPVAPVCSIS